MAWFWTSFIYSSVWERAYDARLELLGEIFPVMMPLCHPFAHFFLLCRYSAPPITFRGLGVPVVSPVCGEVNVVFAGALPRLRYLGTPSESGE